MVEVTENASLVINFFWLAQPTGLLPETDLDPSMPSYLRVSVVQLTDIFGGGGGQTDVHVPRTCRSELDQ